jgi:hypothetical protein
MLKALNIFLFTSTIVFGGLYFISSPEVTLPPTGDQLQANNNSNPQPSHRMT